MQNRFGIWRYIILNTRFRMLRLEHMKAIIGLPPMLFWLFEVWVDNFFDN